MVTPDPARSAGSHPHRGTDTDSRTWDTAIPTPAARIPLSQLRDGDCGTVCECELQGNDGALLRAMGLCPNARVRLCRGGGRMIVAVGSAGGAEQGESRIGLARELAEKILVSPGQ